MNDLNKPTKDLKTIEEIGEEIKRGEERILGAIVNFVMFIVIGAFYLAVLLALLIGLIWLVKKIWYAV